MGTCWMKTCKTSTKSAGFDRFKAAAQWMLYAALLIFFSGCSTQKIIIGPKIPGKSDVYEDYAATQIRVVGLTEIKKATEMEGVTIVNAYVDLLDQFDTRIKSPGSFRFELYDFVPQSATPKGRRLFVWGNVDLIDPVKNNSYFQDFLRTYKFELEMNFVPNAGSKFILDVTFINPEGKRMSDSHDIEFMPL